MRIKHFNRYELKYVLHVGQYERIVEELPAYMVPDRYGDDLGRYAVTSLYYDSPSYKAYWDKIEGHKFRRKVRIRVYGGGEVAPDTPCFAEIKQRIDKTLQKKRVVLPYSRAVALCESGEPVDLESEVDRAIVGEIQYLSGTLALQPACVVAYNRMAFDGTEYDPGLRVTFDTGLKCRIHDLSLLSGTLAEDHYFLPPQWYVMEIKVNYRVPYWLTEFIAKHGCTLRRVSKYCAALERCSALFLNREIVYPH